MNGKLAEQSAIADINWQSHLHPAIELLAQAYRYAYDTDTSCWDFAVEIETLKKLGLNFNDLRWLLLKEYVAHAREITTPNLSQRQYETIDDCDFYDNSCLILTETGYDFAVKLKQSVLAYRTNPLSLANQRPLSDQYVPDTELHSVHYVTPQPFPAWYAETHEFFIGSQLVKEFKLPSANQETILTAFQEENWPKRIDDPLPPVHGVDSKRRLHDTIRGLNRNQKVKLIRFMADGTGEGIRWKLHEED